MRSYIALLILTTFSFGANITSAQKSPQIINSTKTKISPDQVALSFYRWYLAKIYLKLPLSQFDLISAPEVTLTADSIYQIMPKSHFDKLKQTGFFSNDFYKSELAIYNPCNLQLRKVKLVDVDKCGCSPAEFVKNNDCDFLANYNWVGGQGENINSVRIFKKETIGNLSKITVELSADKTVYSHPQVTLIKENGRWKISRIKLRW